MLAFRIIAVVVLVALVLVVGSFFWSLLMPGAGRLDAVAARRIHALCGFNAECKVRINDLFDGNWDTFYEFGSNVPQAGIDSVLDQRVVRARDKKRILVFARDGHVTLVEYADAPAEKPLDGEIEFEEEHHREERTVEYARDAWLRVNSYPIDSADVHRGTYYVLTLIANP